jgi:RNA-binding protein YhbY
MATANIQLGKQGITENFISSLKNYFKTRQNVRISVLKSARDEGKEGKKQVKEYSEKILEKLGKNYTAKIIGFVIVLKKWRKARE